MQSFFIVRYSLNLASFILRLPSNLKKNRCKTGFGCLKQYIWANLEYESEESIEQRVQEQTEQLNQEFLEIENGRHPFIDPVPVESDSRPIALILLSNHDDSYALLGDGAIYCFLMRMRELSQYFKCIARVVDSFDVNAEIAEIQRKYPNREIRHVDIISHGYDGELCTPIYGSHIKGLAKGGSIQVDACSINIGHHNFAQRMSKNTPEIHVYAAKTDVVFSQLMVEERENGPWISAVIYGQCSDTMTNYLGNIGLKLLPFLPKRYQRVVSTFLQEFSEYEITDIQGGKMDVFRNGSLISVELK